MHPHFMGQKSYSQKETEWVVEERFPSGESRGQRHLNWMFGRQKKNKKGEYVFPKDESRLVGEKIDKEAEEVKQGIWTPYRQDDVLSSSLGKKDRRGRVVAVGGTIGHQAYWGKTVRNSQQSEQILHAEMKKIGEDFEARVEQVRKETVAMMEERMDAMVEQKFINLVNKIGLKLLAGMEIEKTPAIEVIHSSCSPSVVQSPDPFVELKSPVACYLGQLDDSQQLVVVAKGLVHPFCANKVVHFAPMKPDHMKVTISSCEPGYETSTLPVPNSELNDVGGAIGSFVQ